MRKETKVWNKLFLPPCPQCKNNDNVEENGTGEIIICGGDFSRIASDKPIKDPTTKSYRCNKCHTIWDTKGNRLQVK